MRGEDEGPVAASGGVSAVGEGVEGVGVKDGGRALGGEEGGDEELDVFRDAESAADEDGVRFRRLREEGDEVAFGPVFRLGEGEDEGLRVTEEDEVADGARGADLDEPGTDAERAGEGEEAGAGHFA